LAARASVEGAAASEAVGSVEAVAATGVPLTVNVGAPEALVQALTERLPLDEPDLRGLREPRAVAVVDGDAMEAVAVPDGGGEPQPLGVPLIDVEGEPHAVKNCEGEPDAVEERDCVTLAVKLGECEAEPDAKAEPLRDTLGDTVPLVVAEGVHVPPQPMYCFSALTQFQLMMAPVHWLAPSGSQRAM
jgi:hypothetical protein